MQVLQSTPVVDTLIPDTAPPLIVDVDGTLLQTDLLWEGLLTMISKRPMRAPGALTALLRGRAAFKAYVAEHGAPDIAVMPMSPSVQTVVDAARAEGRLIILASAANQLQVDALKTQIGADKAWGSNDSLNLSARAKLQRIQEECSSFDYIGNARVDLHMWEKARNAYVVNASTSTLRQARRARPDLIELSSSTRPWRAAVRALRPHQWAKNALLFIPALAAHLAFTTQIVSLLIAGFVSFSLAASAIYVLNDLLDLPHDRRHATKRRRPFAAGELPIPAGFVMIGALGTISLLLSLALPAQFRWLLLAYLALTTAYSFALKRMLAVDVIALATLYTARVVAGAALASVPLSRWFLAFSVFLFLSLALVKRVIELQGKASADGAALPGRGYVSADIPVLTALGGAATLATTLVYCLYITSVEVTRLYRNVDVLWLELPVLLYWQIRVWLLTGRQQILHDDPVVFALRDRASHVTLVIFLAVMLLAV